MSKQTTTSGISSAQLNDAPGVRYQMSTKRFPQADWYVLGDDDTFFIPEALESALSDSLTKYDASKPWYIGAPSESRGRI